MSNQIFVGSLLWSVADEDLVNFFSSYGEIDNGQVIMDRESACSHGLGFITFTSEEAALKSDGAELQNHEIRVNATEQKSSSPAGQINKRYEGQGHY
ncbi:RNA-binding protein [Pelagibaculum spongiae]|uniref:RNA-binding protein n=1 Tax=Pelagibaculum spongiae TaxID=2080658 RepID=A0A2V1GRW2_9GAMM|nr:RNA-binding protein [Pelagibaculum spongiae]PVZ65607.1 RNA-binding protein [Pelagibaculum spongiae]